MKTVWSWRLVNDLFYNLIFYSSGWNWTSNVSLQQTKPRVFGIEISKFLCTEFRCKTKQKIFFFFCNGCIVSWVIPLILICRIARFSGMLPFPHVFEKEFTSFHTSSKLFLKVFFGLFTLFFTCNLQQFTILFSPILLYWAEFQLSQECLFASSNSHCHAVEACLLSLPGWGLFETPLFPECRFLTFFACDPCSEEWSF